MCDCAAGADPGCVAGVDTNPGTLAAPYRSYGRAQTRFESGLVTAGGTIAFCRGGAWDVTSAAGTSWVNAACTATNPCVIRDYAPAGLESAARPLLRFALRSGFEFSDGGAANHEEGVMLLNLDLRGQPRTPTAETRGVFVYNDMDDLLMCGLSIDGFDLGVHVAGYNTAFPPAAGANTLNERVVLRNSTVINSSTQGWLGGGNYNGVQYSNFRNNGFAVPLLDHNVYLSGSSGTTDVGLHAIGNTLYQSSMAAGKCEGVSLVSHGRHDDMLIEGNTVYEDVGAAGNGCWGIAVDTDWDTGKTNAFQRLKVRNNTIRNVGNIGIGITSCQDCVVENNLIVTEQATLGTTGIMIPDKWPPNPPDMTTERMLVRNNTVWLGAVPGSAGIVLELQGTGHAVVGNAVAYMGTSSGFDCMSLGLPAADYAQVDRNACWTPNAPGAEWERGSGGLFAWSLATGFDVNSVSTDPLFSAAPADFTPLAASPLVSAGDPLNAPPDDLYSRVRSPLPEIGALER